MFVHCCILVESWLSMVIIEWQMLVDHGWALDSNYDDSPGSSENSKRQDKAEAAEHRNILGLSHQLHSRTPLLISYLTHQQNK